MVNVDKDDYCPYAPMRTLMRGDIASFHDFIPVEYNGFIFAMCRWCRRLLKVFDG